MEKQNEIAALYQAKQDEIKTLKTRIQKAEDELRAYLGRWSDLLSIEELLNMLGMSDLLGGSNTFETYKDGKR